MPSQSPLQTLLSVLRCPFCSAGRWQRPSADTITCAVCRHSHAFRDGILHLNVLDEHPEVLQERASVPATEGAPELGGWGDDLYAPSVDPASKLGRAYLSLPHGDDSDYFREPGYFWNVQRFAPEFDFVVAHLPRKGLLLDLGADGTWSTAHLARRGLTCVALDITDHLALARLFQADCPPYALVNVDMHVPVFVDAAFDVVTAFNAMHHSKRLDELAANIARVLKPGGVLGFIEPYVQNAQQEADFGAAQSAMGINENVHTLERWHEAFTRVGLGVEVFSLSDSFNAVYRKAAVGHQASGVSRQASRAGGHRSGDATSCPNLFDRFYNSTIAVAPATVAVRSGTTVEFGVTIASGGPEAWSSRGQMPLGLSYHVSRVTAEGIVMVSWDNPRTLLPRFVCPGQPETLTVPVTLREPGLYELEFDLVHEARTWFKHAGGRTATAWVTVFQ